MLRPWLGQTLWLVQCSFRVTSYQFPVVSSSQFLATGNWQLETSKAQVLMALTGFSILFLLNRNPTVERLNA